MKKIIPKSRIRPSQAVCTVSAAALMLGVSHAATIGFNFQTHYCSAGSYSGAVLTAPAFGIPVDNWESLLQMDTGYGCDPGPFTLDQIIDTTTVDDGLHPLPAGSLHVNWSGYVANVSGFGGYGRSGPHYTFGGNSYKPGEEQVYWGFIRDGVNFGPGQSGGDNDKPGYSIEITGLKSVFGTNQFVVQLIASSDSLSSLTNAFVIDATANSTNSVVYTNIPPIGNVGDTPWPRGIGGGLSTASGPVNTDDLIIRGNRAGHGAANSDTGAPAYNNASTIAGFIITDKPVVSMSPQPVFATPGDDVHMRLLAVGAPPLTYQWRKNGAPIPSATGTNYDLTLIQSGGDFDVVVSNQYGSSTSKVATVTVDQLTIMQGPLFTADSKPTGAADNAALLGAVVTATSKDAANVTRTNVASFTATVPSQIVVPNKAANLDSPQGTVSFWFRSTGTPSAPGTDGAMLVDRRSSANGIVIVEKDDGTIYAQAQSKHLEVTSATAVNDDKWHLITFVYDSDTGGSLYIDGGLEDSEANTGAWALPTGQAMELGKSHDPFWRAFDGSLDDIRVYNRQLTDPEVLSIFQTGALVDNAALQVRLNFDGALTPGVTVNWQSTAGSLQSADLVTGPFTNISTPQGPLYVEALDAQKYYRYVHTPVSLVTNPYDM